MRRYEILRSEGSGERSNTVTEAEPDISVIMTLDLTFWLSKNLCSIPGSGVAKEQGPPFRIMNPGHVTDELMSIARAQKIKVIIFDVDGVLTDGTLWFFPTPNQKGSEGVTAGETKADASGYEIVTVNAFEGKGFNAHDGVGMSLARLAGLKLGI